jgi:hypothetical protein
MELGTYGRIAASSAATVEMTARKMSVLQDTPAVNIC